MAAGDIECWFTPNWLVAHSHMKLYDHPGTEDQGERNAKGGGE